MSADKTLSFGHNGYQASPAAVLAAAFPFCFLFFCSPTTPLFYFLFTIGMKPHQQTPGCALSFSLSLSLPRLPTRPVFQTQINFHLFPISIWVHFPFCLQNPVLSCSTLAGLLSAFFCFPSNFVWRAKGVLCLSDAVCVTIVRH